jgi:hypothetical protein
MEPTEAVTEPARVPIETLEIFVAVTLLVAVRVPVTVSDCRFPGLSFTITAGAIGAADWSRVNESLPPPRVAMIWPPVGTVKVEAAPLTVTVTVLVGLVPEATAWTLTMSLPEVPPISRLPPLMPAEGRVLSSSASRRGGDLRGRLPGDAGPWGDVPRRPRRRREEKEPSQGLRGNMMNPHRRQATRGTPFLMPSCRSVHGAGSSSFCPWAGNSRRMACGPSKTRSRAAILRMGRS